MSMRTGAIRIGSQHAATVDRRGGKRVKMGAAGGYGGVPGRGQLKAGNAGRSVDEYG